MHDTGSDRGCFALLLFMVGGWMMIAGVACWFFSWIAGMLCLPIVLMGLIFCSLAVLICL